MLETLLDSLILIDHFNDKREATRYISKLDPARVAISVITRAEILMGFEAGEDQEKAKFLLDQYTLFIIDRDIADKAAELRREFGWKLSDAFQAALAIHHRLKLATRNTKDFNPRKHTFVEVPYSLR
ncbi:MAG: PIN domain-containing protein [Pseudomonadota bacterium]